LAISGSAWWLAATSSGPAMNATGGKREQPPQGVEHPGLVPVACAAVWEQPQHVGDRDARHRREQVVGQQRPRDRPGARGRVDAHDQPVEGLDERGETGRDREPPGDRLIREPAVHQRCGHDEHRYAGDPRQLLAGAPVGHGDGDGHHEPCHSPRYDFNDRLVPVVARVFARLAGAPLPR